MERAAASVEAGHGAKQLLAALLGVAATAAGWLVFAAMGPVPVVVGSEVIPLFVPPFYLALAGLPFGILMAEAIVDFREYRHPVRRLEPVFILLALGGLGAMRMGLYAPISGHSMVAAYLILHELVRNRPGRSWKLLVGTGVLLYTAYYKLFLWDDPATLLAGIGLAFVVWGIDQAVLAAGYYRAEQRR